jgi:hypothetical protein
MPEISRFYGIVIAMFYGDHPPPHFHVCYGEYKAVVRIEDLVVTRGYLPPRALGLVIEWAAKHREELLQNWNAIEQDRPLEKVPPLE